MSEFMEQGYGEPLQPSDYRQEPAPSPAEELEIVPPPACTDPTCLGDCGLGTAAYSPEHDKLKNRHLIVFDGQRWHVRHVHTIQHDGDRDFKVYHCDIPISNNHSTLAEVPEVAKLIYAERTRLLTQLRNEDCKLCSEGVLFNGRTHQRTTQDAERNAGCVETISCSALRFRRMLLEA